MFTPRFSLGFLILSGAFMGLTVGAVMGASACLLLRLNFRFRNILVDGILGAVGFSIGWYAVFFIPWRNTITYYVGDTLVTSTMSHYQHPELLAFIAATLLPVLHELRRFKNLRHQIS
jgi:hypothetical protein